jgi:pSer/pThr/pTyr-binding forkhead associated (FHA) protein
MPVKLMVERQTLSFETDAIGIGRDPDNQVALPNDPRLAPLHAIIRHVNGRWIVESREGGPIRVGNGRPTQFAWLNPGDVIHLTESGPQLVFEPSSNESGAPVPLKPVKSTGPAMVSPPHIPFIPDLSANKTRSNPNVSAVQPVLKAPQTSKTQPQNKPYVIVGIGAISFLILAAAGLMFWTPRSKVVVVDQNPQTDIDSQSKLLAQPEQTAALPVPTVQALEPAEFLVLVGIGDMTSEDRPRPHVLGVGWLWDDRTAVTSREIGEAINEIAVESRNAGTPRQGCVIQGVSFEVVEVRFSNVCSGISLLKLKDSTGLPARKQISLVNSEKVQRQLHLKKNFTYISYGKLTRPRGVKGSHPFPLCEYDTDECQIKDRKAQFLFETGKHFLKPNDGESRLESGGLIFDDSQRILGMTLSDSSIIWTEILERALEAR